MLVQKRLIFGYGYKVAKRVMPHISKTEAAALESGTVGFDREIFNGTPSLDYLKKYSVKLTDSEASFLNNETEQLCAMADDYSISQNRDLPQPIWDFLRKNKFMGMVIPTKYGGLGFSAHGHSQIIQKLCTRSNTVAVSAMVPNSLGPGELLVRYGTEAQKDYFLPKLAKGELIPCFALTGPSSGSDAAAMPDLGTVVNENGVLGIRATFKKRYITLAPVAGVIGLAINLKDPSGLLNGKGEEGITVVLLERNHPGLQVGKRHDPLHSAFMNGPVEGTNVFIPIDKILGGQERAGYGWRMLMECLAEGRGVSLPASSVAAGKASCVYVGAYARIRKQFHVPLAELEGVQEHLARMASQTFIMTSAQRLTNSILNAHEKPAVIAAVMKQQMTDRMRKVINDGMDVLGGAGICNGPQNGMANAYMEIPIGITVEGANILTRTLMQFGQGLTRSHPHLLDMIHSVQHGDDQKGFTNHLLSIVGHFSTNYFGSLYQLAFRKRCLSASDPVAYYESNLLKLSVNFALCSDVALTLGGKIKFAEMLSGRYADVLSNIYIGYSVLWYYNQLENKKDFDAVLNYSMKTILVDTENAFRGIFQNFPIRPAAFFMKSITFPCSRTYQPPCDKDTKAVANLITLESPLRKLFSEAIYLSKNVNEKQHLILETFKKAIDTDKILATHKKNKTQPTAQEMVLINEVNVARETIIQVDSFERLGHEMYKGEKWTHNDRPAMAKIY